VDELCVVKAIEGVIRQNVKKLQVFHGYLVYKWWRKLISNLKESNNERKDISGENWYNRVW